MEKYVLKKNPDGSEITVRDLQLAILEIMDEIHRVCVKNDIPYALIAGSAVNAAAHFLMHVKRFYEYFCRNTQKNEELLPKTRGEIEFRVSKNMWNFGGCEFSRTH